MQRSSTNNRIWYLDAWRGLAVIAMVLFHSLYLAQYLGYVEIDLFTSGWIIAARIVQWSFLLLVGISLHISFTRAIQKGSTVKEWRISRYKRAAVIAVCAALVSLVTWIFEPTWMVRFGILHLITIAVLVYSFTLPYQKYVFVLLGVLVLIPIIQSIELSTEWAWLHVIGFPTTEAIFSFDFFPIIPWLAVPGIGIGIASIAERYRFFPRLQTIQINVITPLSWCGKYALHIYMLHIPVLYGVLVVLDFVI